MFQSMEHFPSACITCIHWPQGYYLNIRNMNRYRSFTAILLYIASDNSLTVADVDLDKIIGRLETDIDILDRRFNNNGMLLNEDKCHFMIIEPTWKTRHIKEKIKLRKQTITETNKAKLLGITFDNKLTMNDHIKNICNQASSKLYALARISQYLDEQKRKILMKSFVISQFNYCPIIWMYCQRKSNNLINRIHERALRVEPHNYPIRTQNLNYPNPRTVPYGVESFGYKGSQIWKRIPKEIQGCDDLYSFKTYVSKNCENLCKCNSCRLYVPNMGYIEHSSW